VGLGEETGQGCGRADAQGRGVQVAQQRRRRVVALEHGEAAVGEVLVGPGERVDRPLARVQRAQAPATGVDVDPDLGDGRADEVGVASAPEQPGRDAVVGTTARARGQAEDRDVVVELQRPAGVVQVDRGAEVRGRRRDGRLRALLWLRAATAAAGRRRAHGEHAHQRDDPQPHCGRAPKSGRRARPS
jgi:hypothetical protein